MAERRCIRCNNLFTPEKSYYRYCHACFTETRPIGGTEVTDKPGVAQHRIGGVSQLRSERRSVLLRGEKTTAAIFEGLKNLPTEIYGEATRVSTILLRMGLNQAEVERLNEAKRLGSIAMELSPKLRDWLITTIGHRPCDVLIDYYGLYGNIPLTASDLVERFHFEDEGHAKNYIAQMIRELGKQEKRSEMEILILEVARNHLTRD